MFVRRTFAETFLRVPDHSATRLKIMPAFLDSVTPVGFATNNQQMACEAQQVDSIREQAECHNPRKSAKGSSSLWQPHASVRS